jgi:peptide chain release factor 3
MAGEYGVAIGFEATPYNLARWISGEKLALAKFVADQRTAMADDVDGDPVFLATSVFMMKRTAEMNAGIAFRDIKDHKALAG